MDQKDKLNRKDALLFWLAIATLPISLPWFMIKNRDKPKKTKKPMPKVTWKQAGTFTLIVLLIPVLGLCSLAIFL